MSAILFMFLSIAEYGELIAAIVAILGMLIGTVWKWSKISTEMTHMQLDMTDSETNINTQIEQIKKTEKENHRESLEKIEAMRRERHEEIVALKEEIVTITKENRTENAREHETINSTLKILGETLAEMRAEIRVKCTETTTKRKAV